MGPLQEVRPLPWIELLQVEQNAHAPREVLVVLRLEVAAVVRHVLAVVGRHDAPAHHVLHSRGFRQVHEKRVHEAAQAPLRLHRVGLRLRAGQRDEMLKLVQHRQRGWLALAGQRVQLHGRIGVVPEEAVLQLQKERHAIA
eukprot:scaffold952_cov249-Pinguiococcus_pyrenoidosus.AAC.14